MISFQKFSRTISIFVLAALAACGGGGGGSTTTVAGGGTNTTPAVPVTYDDAISFLNVFRVSSGFNSLTKSTELEISATRHNDYLSTVDLVDFLSHDEDPSRTGFTGVTPKDRAVAAGYPLTSQVGEGLTTGKVNSTPVDHVKSLLSVPYHSIVLLGLVKEIGMSSKVVGSTKSYFTVDVGYRQFSDEFPADSVRVFPCGGVSDVPYKSLGNESPAPIPGRNIGTDPIGLPIIVMSRRSNSLSVISQVISRKDTGEIVPVVKILDLNSNPTSSVAILPDKPLAPGVQYDSKITVLNNGKTSTITCSFTTSTA